MKGLVEINTKYQLLSDENSRINSVSCQWDSISINHIMDIIQLKLFHASCFRYQKYSVFKFPVRPSICLSICPTSHNPGDQWPTDCPSFSPSIWERFFENTLKEWPEIWHAGVPDHLQNGLDFADEFLIFQILAHFWCFKSPLNFFTIWLFFHMENMKVFIIDTCIKYCTSCVSYLPQHLSIIMRDYSHYKPFVA